MSMLSALSSAMSTCCIIFIMLGFAACTTPLHPLRNVLASQMMPKHYHKWRLFRGQPSFLYSRKYTSTLKPKQIFPIVRRYTNHRPIIVHHQQHNICTAKFAKFEVGDKVLIDWNSDTNTSCKTGIIEEIRGGGWYTLCLCNDVIRVKRRGSQLKKDFDELSDQSTSHEKIVIPLPEVKIVDLDAIFQHMDSHSSSSIEDAIFQSEHKAISEPERDMIERLKSCHRRFNRWIIFSDLHVMPTTLSTCIKVLDFVHVTAMERQAGILFLGDFWHHRGFVRVDCLNAVLESMSKWKVPSIMIPGNHDQVNWSGTEHALTPLKNAYRISCQDGSKQNGALILSHPTKFMNALFIPHTRDKSMMKTILASSEAAHSTALFVHADVKGASMNDLIKSQHGISADHFPRDKLIFSGHFHKPHIVSMNNLSEIRYVGSPYQTSLAESGQSKYLLLVDSNQHWNCIEEIEIDIGRKYHRVSSVSSFLNIDQNETVRAGDKVALIVPQQDLDEMRIISYDENRTVSFDAKINELRDKGVAVEIRNIQNKLLAESSLPTNKTLDEDELEVEDLSPKATLEAYIKNEVDSGILDEESAQNLLSEGYKILNELTDNDSTPSPSVKYSVTLELDSVSVVGFGSFRKEVNYPLNNRGVVLLRGSNKDFGSDSNGVGKSTLAMASLWALTGTLDTRPVQDGKVADIVNDFSKTAEVTLRGSLNSKSFLVKRTKNASSGTSLSFFLDGSDLTLQSPSDTQRLVNEHFSSESQLLMRSIFHGQHAIDSLLESSDAKLKDELSSLISLDIWQNSASLVRSKHREAQKKVSEQDGMLIIRRKDAEEALLRCQSAEAEMNSRRLSVSNERKSLIERQKSLSDMNSRDLDDSISALHTKLDQCSTTIATLEHELLAAADNQEIKRLRSQLDETTSAQNRAESELLHCAQELDTKKAALVRLNHKLNAINVEWGCNGSNNTFVTSPQVCQTCGQSITSEDTIEYLKQSAQSRIDAISSEIRCVKAEVAKTELLNSKTKDAVAAFLDEAKSQRKILQKEEELFALRSQDLRHKLNDARLLHQRQSFEYSSLIKQSQMLTQTKIEKSSIQSDLQRLSDSLSNLSSAYEACRSDLRSTQQNIKKIEEDKEANTARASLYRSLTDVFGSKGIQTFVLRNVVQALQHYSQAYLDELSNGSLQLLFEVGQNDNIVKQAKIIDRDGIWRTRPLSSLSGGQWRRCSLSLSLGFIELASRRGKLRSSLLVLDEPLTHLDSAGRQSVGKLLRRMLSENDETRLTQHKLGGLGLSTILVILQDIAAEEIEESFDYIDEVIKSDGESCVVLEQEVALG